MLRTLLSDLPGIWKGEENCSDRKKGISHLPGVLLRVEVDDRPEDHELCAATLEQ